MYGLLSATQVGIVHEVVVQQGVVMIGLQANSRHQDILGLFAPEVVTQQGKNWTDAFAANGKHVLYGLVE